MSVKVEDSVGATSGTETWPPTSHNVTVLIANPASKADLQHTVHDCVTTPTTICIGVSPKLRFTWTEIGIDTGILSSDYQQVGRAGNADFKEGHWADGISSIISRANVLTHAHAEQATGVIVQEHVVEHPVSATPFLVGFGVLGCVVGAGVWYTRRQNKRVQLALENAQRETAEMAARNLREDDKWKKLEEKVGPSGPTPTPRKLTPIARPAVSARTRTPAPVRTGPVYIHAPSPPAVVVLPEPTISYAPTFVPRPDPPTAPMRRRTPTPPSYKSPTPAPTSSWSSSFDSFSGGGGGGGFDGGSSGGGGGGEF